MQESQANEELYEHGNPWWQGSIRDLLYTPNLIEQLV